jgi:hypothetical protein
MEDAMRLTPSDAEPGLWVNPNWQEGTPGMFAVVIGVSHYPHLADGEVPAPETFGLGQLRVSALTAFEVFRWLARDTVLRTAPWPNAGFSSRRLRRRRNTYPGSQSI